MASVTSNVINSGPIPLITSNMDLPAIATIRKYSGVPHGMSLAALTVLDTENRKLTLDLTFENDAYMMTFADQLVAVWGKYEPIPSFIRSYKVDGKYMSSFNGESMQLTSQMPSTHDMFGYKKAIIDIELIGLTKIVYKIWRWGEDTPRMINLSV